MGALQVRQWLPSVRQTYVAPDRRLELIGDEGYEGCYARLLESFPECTFRGAEELPVSCRAS